jgi:serine/threonine-protein kinase
MTRLEAAQRIGDRYTLVDRIGAGGMADVWCADDEMLGRRVALKFMHERFAQDEQFVERFRREAQAAAGLQHPNMVGVYDRGEWEGRPWIAMEYVEGASLKELIARGLEVGEALEIVRQVLAGARFAHGRGIVHRDLKPQNVIVDSEGRARVLDFGIARAGASEITQTGSVLGTAQYLSPEQAQGLEITPASDLYSIGVILYEALTGRVPFEADSPVAVALKQVSEQPRPPSELNQRVPPALDAVCLRALAKDPENRFASADDFLRALDAAEVDPTGRTLGDTASYLPVAAGGAAAAAPGEPASATGAPPPYAKRTWMTRRRAAVLAAIALLAGGAAAFALTRQEQVRVPNVLEEPLTEARARLTTAGFEVDETFAPTCSPANTVTEQNPPAGSDADEGAAVRLTVSSGLRVQVPSTSGLPIARASRRIDRADLLPETRDRPSRNVDPGRVIESDPAAGQEVDCRSTVTLLVSSGPNLVTLPDVLGDQEETAEAELQGLGLLVNVETRDDDAPEGTVIGQSPGPGSELTRGAQVTIIVSTGAGSVIVPGVVGQSEDSARETLESRGLDPEGVTQETDDQSEDGRVIEQSPSAGTRVRQGDPVTIVIGRFVEPEPEFEPEGPLGQPPPDAGTP